MSSTGETSISSAEDTKPSAQEVATMVGGDVELLECVGVGGMGTVYRAFHRSLQMPVAVKIVRNPNQLALRRLQKEAQSLSNLAHPNIIKVLKFQSLGESSCALTMEYFPGVDLSHEIARGPMTRNACINIFRQVCAALEHAHQNHIVHRDVKPSNILLANELDGSITVKLVDFGIASNLAGSDQKLTSTGAVIGSPSYMSPEQCSGAPVDARADIYSLGCVLYECLSGKRPFEGNSSLEVMYKQLNEQVQRPANISEACFAVIQRAMAQDPANRYQTVAEFASALEAAAGQEGPAARTRRMYLHPAIIPAMVVTLGITLVAALGTMVLSSRSGSSGEESIGSMNFDKAVNYLDAQYLARGQAPPGAMIEDLQLRTRTVTEPKHLTAFGDLCFAACEKFPDRRRLYDPAARHAYDRAITALHMQGRPAQIEQAKLCVNLLQSPQAYIRDRAVHCVDEEIKWGKSNNDVTATRRARVDKLAFLLITGDKPEFLKLRQSCIANGFTIEQMKELAGESKDHNALLQRVYALYPGFPDEPAE